MPVINRIERDYDVPLVLNCEVQFDSANDLIPCETNPETGAESRQFERFHAYAEVTIGTKVPLRHVCRECAKKWHKSREQRLGIRWA